ncbi:glycosyltransferase family 4 protein [Marinitoga sp. 1155]|uniref:glycosyltransferase family 4 protein n=1 Tax=Marinitoga sp. 1155 TaxID=1428448 RepID=UPI000659C6B6|nr:glycosyltransferase family 4 protein [Marinitoga sp. 1155]KLO21176.1 hypothetical protein X274_10870 [Marinitoga sp. 1155]
MKNFKIMVINNGYPSKDNIYSNVFVQKRLESYKKYNEKLDIRVIKLIRKAPLPADYIYNNIEVKYYLIKDVFQAYKNYNPNIILIHFFPYYLLNFIKSLNIPVIIWVHGFEALSWKRRLFNFTFDLNFVKYIVSNKIQLKYFNKLISISNSKNNIFFVFVSKWMKNTCFKDIGRTTKNYKIIPNFIDTEFFYYLPKTPDYRKKILMIRSFKSRKYATDIAVKAIKYLSKIYPNFSDLEFTIVGNGKFWKKDISKIKNFNNIKIVKNFLNHEKIKELHGSNGILLSPTRQDSQGVSMCEAMSSGLVPITSLNTAIPEFVNTSCGYLTKNYMEAANAIIELYENKELFIKKSKKAAEFVRNKCSFHNTIEKELNLIYDLVNKNL